MFNESHSGQQVSSVSGICVFSGPVLYDRQTCMIDGTLHSAVVLTECGLRVALGDSKACQDSNRGL